jgi:predicted dehydrogenase
MNNQKNVRIGIIGLGPRAETLLASIFKLIQKGGVEVTAICDLQNDRIEKIHGIFDKQELPRPRAYNNYHEMLAADDVDAILAPTSWNSHLQIACDAMRAGKSVGIEVGGAASIDELWQLVHAAESTKVNCMMLENCCYGRNELMVLNMVRKGLFGELIYCEAGYEHCIGKELALTYENNGERCLHNIHRNGELYPTHGLGPIAKILNINRGNRFLTVSSHATKSRGFSIAMEKHLGKKINFNQGDVVTTVIHCANGENITLTHGVSLPRPYSRNCRVQGTKGIWLENAKSMYVDGISPYCEKIDMAGNPYDHYEWTPIEDFYEKHDHPIWEEYHKDQIGGHDGMDALALMAFFDSVRNNTPAPIDVYDCAAWMCITCLSEQSIALGGMPVPVPDFTNGKWVSPRPEKPSRWSLNEIFPECF